MSEEPSLAGVLALIEKHGSVVVPTRVLEGLVPPAAREALHAAKVIGGAPPMSSWPCETRGCGREIRASGGRAPLPLVAVCSQAPPACEPVGLTFEDIAQQRVSVPALVLSACALFGVKVDAEAVARLGEAHAARGAEAPVAIGAVDGAPARDVFWARAPRDMDLASFCARRERAARGTCVLVPTMRHVDTEVATRFATGEHVEVRALEEGVFVRAGALVRGAEAGRRGPRSAGAQLQPGDAGQGLAARLGVSRWEEIRITVVDGHTVRIAGGKGAVLRTFVELGFVDERKRSPVEPVKGWSVLLLMCKAGALRPSDYRLVGKTWAAKKAVETLRTALRGAFGLEGDPLRRYTKSAGWEPRFLVAG